MNVNVNVNVNVDDDDDTRAFKRVLQHDAIPTTDTSSALLFNTHTELKQSCDAVMGALGPNPALSNPDKAHVLAASVNFTLRTTQSHSVSGRVGVAPLLAIP